MPSEASAMRAAADSKRGITSQAMLHCMQHLVRNEAPRAKQCCYHAFSSWSDSRHHTPSDAALHAAPDAKRGTMCQAMLPPCVQLLIRREAPHTQRCFRYVRSP